MSSTIQFISLPSGTSITPSYGLLNDSFVINGENLNQVSGVLFVDKFQNEIASTFTATSPTVINGSVPLLDSSLGRH